MYRNDNRINLDRTSNVEDADKKIKSLVKLLHLTICKINKINRETGYKIADVNNQRTQLTDGINSEKFLENISRFLRI